MDERQGSLEVPTKLSETSANEILEEAMTRCNDDNSNVLLVSMNVSSAYISIGGNRNPASADWDEGGLQLLAFGADNSIALWDPQASQFYQRRGIDSF
jgi:hypothetical protein